MYDNGEGTAVDKNQAFYWFSKAAEQGFAWAQNNLGRMYSNGEGTAVDKNQAFYWFSKAAEQGFAEAQCNLGSMYYNGEGTDVDKTSFLLVLKGCRARTCKANIILA
ncbi:hypothetical protein TPHV1_490002 [Treponema phagedenis]|uniref:Sel1 repeat family protein n=1 Tax=Treponema phagedenis TaxID=162 RepID=A0A0B7H0H0_TREPH|nr:tetratricopeptide repeat protein [Treponema phagedenis]QSH95510.1 sel1 repeat family protein [Treponema phagedenis]CEM62740.1 hypothetical protein TPHV1_490002 [Treponema phagedenis]